MSATPVYDEYDREWLVYPDDPVFPVIRRLKNQGYRLFALPAETIVTGQPVPVPQRALEEMDKVSKVYVELRERDGLEEVKRGVRDRVFRYDQMRRMCNVLTGDVQGSTGSLNGGRNLKKNNTG